MKESQFLSNLRPFITRILQRTRLNKLAHKVYYNYVHGFNPSIATTLPAVERVLREAKETGVSEKGDYLEFGIFKGYTFLHVQNWCKENGLDTLQFYGFDSFSGLPEVTGVDETKHNEFYKGQYKCAKDKVVSNLNSGGVDWGRTQLIEGYFCDTLNDETRARFPELQKVAIALIDCDLYSSTVEVLDFIRDMLVEGSILMLDDWNSFSADNERGERRAFGEFVENNPHITFEELFEYPPYGMVYRVARIA